MTQSFADSKAEQKGTALNSETFLRAAKLAFDSAGLTIPISKQAMVQSRLSRRLKATGLTDFDDYLDFVESYDGRDEREEMLSALTTNVSHFFREDHHFRTLRETLIPRLGEKLRSGDKVRIWSAGCSNGQEPYTIAINFLEFEPKLNNYDLKILATDIDRKVLSFATKGRYDERQVSSVPNELQRKYFRSVSKTEFEICPNVRSLIAFRRLNLIDKWPMTGIFDVVFCRNVVIYFSEDTQNALWPRFNRVLSEEGLFFLGHSERIQDPIRHGFAAAGVTTYKKMCKEENLNEGSR